MTPESAIVLIEAESDKEFSQTIESFSGTAVNPPDRAIQQVIKSATADLKVTTTITWNGDVPSTQSEVTTYGN